MFEISKEMDAKEINDTITNDEKVYRPIEIPSSPCSVESSVKASASVKTSCSEEMKVEGWLKLSGTGFRKTTGKQVWFVYRDDTGKLYYYLQPQDLLPLGEIDLRQASLTYDVSNKDGLFEIRSGGKVYSIDAQEQAHMLIWLDALQKKRRAFSVKQSELAHDLFMGEKEYLDVSGLLGQKSANTDEVFIHSMDNLPTEMRSEVMTVHTSQAGKGILDTASSGTSNEDLLVVTGRPTPPASLPLISSFSAQWQSNFESSPFNQEDVKESECTDIFTSHSDARKSLFSQSESSVTLTFVKSEHPALDDSQLPAASPVSPLSANTANGKSKILSVLRNNFKIMKETVKEKKGNMSVKHILSSTAQSTESAADISQFCCKCRVLDEELLFVKDELKAAKEELHANKEIAGLLQKEVYIMKAVINTSKGCEGKNKDEIIQVLHQKDKHIAELEHSRAAVLDEKNLLTLELRNIDNTLKDYRDQISMFQQTLAVKDEIIISLSNKIQELQNNNRPDLTDVTEDTDQCFSFPNSPTSPAVDRKELERLTDMCKAYEDQNKFLTNEILELNALRQDDAVRERLLKMSVAKAEAQYYQTRSKYLYLLNEVQTPVRGGDENRNQEVVSQLLQEALESESETQDDDEDEEKIETFVSSQRKEHDCYGFVKSGYDEGNMLVSRANILRKQSLEIEYMIKNTDEEISKSIRWENFMVGLSPNKPLVRSSDIKFLLRLGIPNQFRERIWNGCINLCVRPTRKKLGDKYYKDLEERAKNNKSNPAIKQIELDLLRTLPDNKYFDKIDSPGIRKLRRVLLCYSIHNPFIGYCQGINRLAAIALLFLSEEDAFWCLVAITEHLVPIDYYTATLAAAQADQRVLKDLVQEKCPKLYTHMEVNDADLTLFTFNWFLTVFVDGVTPEVFLRVWDVFLYEGSKVLFRFALAFLKYAEDEILKQPNNLAINRYMRTLGETITDVRRVYNIAFSELNPFPMRSISSKRFYHLQNVKLELEELEKIRRELRSAQEESEQRQDRQDNFSEDDLDDDAL